MLVRRWVCFPFVARSCLCRAGSAAHALCASANAATAERVGAEQSNSRISSNELLKQRCLDDMLAKDRSAITSRLGNPFL